MYILRTVVRVWGEKGEGTWDGGGYERQGVYIRYVSKDLGGCKDGRSGGCGVGGAGRI